MDKYEFAFNEWHEKTQWVQDDKRFDVVKPWGKHRADVLKEYMEHLEAQILELSVKLANVESKCVGLAAENASLKSKGHEVLNEACKVYEKLNATISSDSGDFIDGQTLHEFQFLLDVETTATDAYLAEVRAKQHTETLNDLVSHIDKNIDIGSLKTPWELSSEIVDYVNQQLHSEFAAAGIQVIEGE